MKTITSIILVAGLCTAASADIYGDRSSFEGDNPGLSTLDFEDIANPGEFLQPAPDFSPFGVTFSDPGGSGANVAISDSGFAFNTPTDVLFMNAFDVPLHMTFSPNVLAVGMELAFGFGGVTGTVSAYDSAGGLLETISLDTESETIFTTFVGFGNVGDIALVTVSPDSGGFVLVDNVSYGVPTPGALALLGLSGIAAVRRRR